jgi:hypothetical protein
MAFVIAAFLDHVQSIVVAMLISILAPTYTTEQPLIRVAAMGIYLSCQVLFYAAMVVFIRVSQSLSVTVIEGEIFRRVFMMTLTLLVFYGLREVIITILYRLMLARYETTRDEFQSVVV